MFLITFLQEVSIWSEFSGYGTAELAAKSVLANMKSPPVVKKMSSADVSAHCRQIIGANHEDSCIFGDIQNLVPEETLQKMHCPVVESIPVTGFDVSKAVKALKSRSIRNIFNGEGRLTRSLGSVHVGARLLGLENSTCAGGKDRFEEAVAALEAGGSTLRCVAENQLLDYD